MEQRLKNYCTWCLLLVALMSVGGGRSLGAAEASFKVTGAVAQPAIWTTDRLRKVFASQTQTIAYTLKGAHHTAHVVPLLAVIDWSHPRFNPHIKHHQLQFVIEVEGQDGYTADFSLAELLPEIGNRKVWIALDQDGKPLVDEEGPVEIIAPEDSRPARWVHGIAAINVADTASN